MAVRRIALVAGAATVGLLALGGTAIASSFDDDVRVPTPGPVSVSQPAAAASADRPGQLVDTAPADTISAERAGEIALAAVGGGTIGHVERDGDDDRREWEVEIHLDGFEHDLDVDAVTGEVRDHDVDDDDRDDDRDDNDDDRWDD